MKLLIIVILLLMFASGCTTNVEFFDDTDNRVHNYETCLKMLEMDGATLTYTLGGIRCEGGRCYCRGIKYD